MARRNLNLEKEFKQFVNIHKLSIIQVALIIYADEGIYDNNLLKKYKDIDLDKEQKAEYIVENAYDNEEYFNELYELCWEKVNHIIPDDMVFDV